MEALPPSCLLQAVQAEGIHCIAIDPALTETEHGAVHYCGPLLTLLAAEPQFSLQVPILLVLFKDQATSLPQWIASLAAEIQPQSAPGVWRLKLANGLSLMLLLCEREVTNPLPQIEALLPAATDASPAVVLIDGEGVPLARLRHDLPGCYRELGQASKVALVWLTCAADYYQISEARDLACALLYLYIHADAAGKYIWETRYHGYIAGNQLSPDQLQNLQSALLRINQAEMLINEKALAMGRELRQQQARGDAWFTGYHMRVDIQFLLRSDDPRWGECSYGCLHRFWRWLLPFPYDSRDPAQPTDYRNSAPYAPPQLADFYQGYLFYCLHGFELSLADIAAIGSVRFFLTVHYEFTQRGE